MKTAKFLFLWTFIIIPIIIFPAMFIILNQNPTCFPKFNLSIDYGVSNYKIPQSVTYQVEINFSLTHNSYAGPGDDGDYWFQFSRLNNRLPNSTLSTYCGPYQQSFLNYSNISGTASTPFVYYDQFNNTYDVFNNTLSPSEKISLSQCYIVTLNEVTFSDIELSEIGEYNTSNEIFALYCNNTEVYYEKDDPILNATSYSIVDIDDNPVVKAQKICNWVSDYLTYNDSLPAQEKGAKWAYDNQQGDCSEYSSLMITLLRCQGIPARKITGYVISNDPTTRPYIGQEWTFTLNTFSTNFLGHAWVEYYVPNIGWIACDPTWNTEVNYFNHIDYLRFNLNVGAWFSLPGGLPNESEFPHPCIVYDPDSYFTYQYTFEITVIDTNLQTPDFLTILIFAIIIGIIIIVIVALIMSSKKKRKSEEMDISF